MSKRIKYIIFTFLCLCACAILFFSFRHKALLRVYFVDVGYGDAIFIQTLNNMNILIDAGGNNNSHKLLRFLKNHKIHRIDAAIITHPHKDHFEGFFSIIQAIPIRFAFVNGDHHADLGYQKLLNEFSKKKIPVSILKAGYIISLDEGTTLKILSPKSLKGNANDDSIVSLLTYKNVSMLFTANISEEGQKRLSRYKKEIEKAQCVQISHHGKSVNLDFLHIFNNANFIISTGKSRWGLPNEKKLRQIHGKIFRTDKLGTILI
jgi:beta-lactamase superfamily II metal-dependent hydrolase